MSAFLFAEINTAQTLSTFQLDSLYNLFVYVRTPSSFKHNGIQSIDTLHIKCATEIVNSIKLNFNRFTITQQKVLQGLLQRPTTDTSFVSPNGFFRIHFSKSDYPDYVPDNIRSSLSSSQLQEDKKIYLDSLAIALDSAYNFEVNYLGYPPPPSDGKAGGDGKYDIYIQNLGSTYGYTEPDSSIGNNKWTTFMVIDDNFAGFYTTRIYAARVTVAHEFHHSIQLGNYIDRYDDSNGNLIDAFFYELTSVSMEHFVYPSIHDYYQYLPYYFQYPQSSFTQNGTNQEYALGIWNIFLKEKFGYNIIKDAWQYMPQMRAIQSISKSLVDYNTTFAYEFSNFGVWMYFTNSRTKPGLYFQNAKDYPLFQPSISHSLTSSLHITGNVEPLTNTLISVPNSSNSDLLSIIVTNGDIQSSIDSNSTNFPFEYNLYDYPSSGSVNLTGNYYFMFSADKPAYWLTSEILNDLVIRVGNSELSNINYAYPSPFDYKNNVAIYLPVQANGSGNVELDIYSISMRLVYSANKPIANQNGKNIIIWNALKNSGGKLASGVYIYVVKSGNNVTKGKIVIINE
jgi:hypothetical protein